MTTVISDKQPWWKYIIDKILSWPFIFIIVFCLLYRPFKAKIEQSNEIKIGDFQMTVNKIAESFGISNVIHDISNLSYDELKLF